MSPDTAIETAYEDYQVWDSATPEKNLMRAILRSAMDDIKRRGEAYRDAKRFFLCEDDQYLFSFVSICYNLELCPNRVRRILGVLPSSMEDDRLAA